VKIAARALVRTVAVLCAWAPLAAQAAPGAAPLAPAVDVQVGVPSPLFAVAAAELRRVPGVASVRPFDAEAIDAAAAPVLLFAVPEFALARLAARGRLGALPLASPMSYRGRGRAGYALVLAMPYTLAYDPQVVPPEAVPATWEQLATSRELRRGLGMVDPAVDLVPWLAGMALRRQGGGDDAGFALWTTLDARVVLYASGYDELLAALAGRRIAATVLPTAVAEPARRRQGLPPLAHRPLDRGGPVALLGLAVAARGEADIGPAMRVAETLLAPAMRAAFAAAVGIEAVADGSADADPDAANAADPPALDLPQAERWLEHFAARIRGRGRPTEDLADTIDFVFVLLFLGFIVFVWLRLRRIETKHAGTADS
jgi:hypothetical protein